MGSLEEYLGKTDFIANTIVRLIKMFKIWYRILGFINSYR